MNLQSLTFRELKALQLTTEDEALEQAVGEELIRRQHVFTDRHSGRQYTVVKKFRQDGTHLEAKTGRRYTPTICYSSSL